MSDLARNKAIVQDFIDSFSRADWDHVGELCTEDFRWITPMSSNRHSPVLKDFPSFFPEPGCPLPQMLEIFRQICLGCVDGKFEIVLESMTAEADRVSAEGRGHAINKANERVYDNRYHYLFHLRDGRISQMREYQDTLLAFDVWYAP